VSIFFRCPPMVDPGSQTPAEGARRKSDRARQPMEKFKPNAAKKAEKEEFIIKPGKGAPLGDMETVCALMGRLGSNDPSLITLHRLCYNRAGKTTTRKRNLRLFSGISDSSTEEQVLAKVVRVKPSRLLRRLTDLLGCTPEGSRTVDDLAGALAHFLMKPKDHKKPLPPTIREKAAKRKAAKDRRKESLRRQREKAAKEKAKKEKAGKPKRPPTGYLLYNMERGPAIRKKHPDWGIAEVSSRISREWAKMEDDEKKPYEKKARKLLEAYKEAVAKWEKKQRGGGSKKDKEVGQAKRKRDASESESESEGSDEEDAPPPKKAKVSHKKKTDQKMKKGKGKAKEAEETEEDDDEDDDQKASAAESESDADTKAKAKKQKPPTKGKGKDKSKDEAKAKGKHPTTDKKHTRKAEESEEEADDDDKDDEDAEAEDSDAEEEEEAKPSKQDKKKPAPKAKASMSSQENGAPKEAVGSPQKQRKEPSASQGSQQKHKEPSASQGSQSKRAKAGGTDSAGAESGGATAGDTTTGSKDAPSKDPTDVSQERALVDEE